MIKKIAALLSIAALAVAFPVSLLAQAFVFNVDSKDVRFVTAYVEDDTTGTAAGVGNGAAAPAFWVKYVGSEESGTVDGIANGIEFFSGPLGSEVINGSAGFDVNTGDVCGTTNDTLLYNDAECNTPEELCAVINASGAPWRCVLAGVREADSLGTDADYVDAADAQAKLSGGKAIYADNSAADTLAVLVRPDVGFEGSPNTGNRGQGDIEFFLNRPAANSYAQSLKVNAFDGRRVVLTYVRANVDSTTAWDLRIIAVKYRGGGLRDERVVYFTNATTDATDKVLDFSDSPLVSGPGETFVIEVLDDALVTGNINYNAFFIPAR